MLRGTTTITNEVKSHQNERDWDISILVSVKTNF